MRRRITLSLASAISLVISTQSVRADEEKVPLDKIPKKVTDSLMAKFPKAKIDKCTKEKEGDAVVYDIEFKQENGRKAEADIKEDGTFINYEKEIDAKDVPKAVREAIEKKYPKANWTDIMEETEVKGRQEKLSAYEVTLETADKKKLEVRVSPEGKILEDSSEEKKDKK